MKEIIEKLKAAQRCHPNAVQVLIAEALHLSHLQEAKPTEAVQIVSDEIGVQLYEEMQDAINDYCVAGVLPFSVINSWEIIFEHWLKTKDSLSQTSGGDDGESALSKYGKHLINCLGDVSGRECTCGLSQAISRGATKPQRITEQDVREIVNSFNKWFARTDLGLPGLIDDFDKQVLPVYLKDEGRTLLAKLNEHREPENRAAMPDDVKLFMRQAIIPILKACGNSYANSWCEKLLKIAKYHGAYKGELVGSINALIDELDSLPPLKDGV